MATIQERVQTAWATGDPLALHREVERLAAEGYPQSILEQALESLLSKVRSDGGSEESQEIIHGVWGRLTGWCHSDRKISSRVSNASSAGVDLPINDALSIDAPIKPNR